MKRYFSTLLLGGALLLPVATVRAQDDYHRQTDRQRYYDPYGRDYHNWDNREDQAYRRYLHERNEEYREYARMNKQRQREYWKWRHHHPDVGDMDRETPRRTR
jgi:hypothetical protein